MRQNIIAFHYGRLVWTLFVPLAGVAVAVACSHPTIDEATMGAASGDGVSASTTGSSGDSSSNSGASAAAGSTSGGNGTITGNDSTGGSLTGAGASTSGAGSSSGTGIAPIDYDAGPPAVVVDSSAPPVVTKMACPSQAYMDPYTPGFTPSAATLSTTSSLVSAMSISDKATMMRGVPGCNNNYNVFHQPGLASVQGLAFRDGPRGVNLQEELPAGANGYSTAFPSASLRGATFDVALEEKVGEAMGDEMSASHGTMLLAPVINILRHPLWGRAQETYGEDSILLGRMGAAFTVGVQKYVPACAKHFAANNIDLNRNYVTAKMDEQTFHEIYGRQYEIVVQEGGVACIMAAYNFLQIGSNPAAKCTQNKELLTDMLRTTFGFKGFVLSDWWAMPGGSVCPLASTAAQTAQDGVNAGLDMELPWSYNYSKLESVTGAGKPLAESQLTTSATRIVEQQVRFNVATPGQWGLQKTTTTSQDPSSKSIKNSQSHIALAYKAALEGMVLLKNDKGTLPIPKTVKSVAVLSASAPYTLTGLKLSGTVNFATAVRTGDLGSSRVDSDPALSTSPYQGIKTAAGSVAVSTGTSATLAAGVDFVVVVAGLTPEDEGEEYTGAADRFSLSLDGRQIHDNPGTTSAQNTLITQVAAAAKAKNIPVVVVLEGGAVIDMPWIDSVNAVVMAWYPGMDGGHALGDLLFGNANFSGKLPVSWVTQQQMLSSLPAFSQGTTTTMDYFLGYRYLDKNNTPPQFPFGFGLSYTSFAYSNLQVPCSTVAKDGVVNVQVDIANTGTMDGDEVAFLFVSFPSTQQRRSVKELKAFRRVTIKAGQTQRITIPLRVSDLKYWDTASGAWKVESGPVQVMVGPSSANLPLKDMMTVN